MDHTPARMSTAARLTGLVLLASAVLFLALRGAWLGHLLVWDEAMQLCTVRSFVSQGEDYFSLWFWRHPPLFSLLLALLRPLSDGFAERSELVVLTIGFVNLCLLWALNRRCFGGIVAAASVFCMAVMPGAVFFDTWIKADVLAVTFGLLGLLGVQSGRFLLGGLCVGLAMATKETGVFYALGGAGLWVAGASGSRRLRDVAGFGLAALAGSGWWYLGVLPLVGMADVGFLGHVGFSMQGGDVWVQPWHYYLRQMGLHMGGAGLLCVILGLAAFAWRWRWALSPREGCDRSGFRCGAWPVAVVVPSLLLLSGLPAKVPWIVIGLLPALATLQGIAFGEGLEWMGRKLTRAEGSTARLWRLIIAGLCALVAVWWISMVVGRDYESVLRKLDEGQWRGARLSCEAAEAMNRVVTQESRVLLTSFHYWKGLSPGAMCPIFTCYSRWPGSVLLRPSDASGASLRQDVRTFRIHWALLSPEPGVKEGDVFGTFMRKERLRPWRLRGAYLFKTDSLWADGYLE